MLNWGCTIVIDLPSFRKFVPCNDLESNVIPPKPWI